jgi:two-component system LytT family sensor kinase
MGSRRFWVVGAVIWTLFGLITGFQVWISMITHGHSMPRLVGYYVLVWEAWVGITAIVVCLVRRWPIIPANRLNIAVHALAGCVVGVIHIVYWMGLMLLMRPFDVMTTDGDHLRALDVLFSRMPLELILYIAALGAVQAIDYYDKYRARTTETAQLQASLNEAKLHALELQLQPHFLFNTLNAVSSLVRTGRNDRAVTMIAGLSDLLRYTLDRSGEPRVTLEEETNTLRRYLEIERVRFVDRLEFDIEITDETRHAAVPTLILQPLAENAVRHGLSRSAGEGRINVRAFRENGHLRIDIFNTGTLDDRAPRGIGLQNTIERLKQMYGDAHRFDLRNEGDGVKASLSIPWSELT